jgi:hypothetical protein
MRQEPDRELGIRYGNLSDEDLRRSYEAEDRRWSRGHQLRDWIVLLALVLVTVAWGGIVFLLEPGLR